MRSIEKASPGCVSVADHELTSSGSSQSVALRMRDALPLDRRAERPVRLRRVVPDARHRQLGRRDRGERVLHAYGSVVERMVVRHVHHVDAGRLQRGERRRRRAEVVVLARDRFAAVGHRGLEVDHRQVGLREHRRDGVEHVAGVRLHLLSERGRVGRRPVLGVPLLGEVHVARERERHRGAVPARTASGGGASRGPVRRCRGAGGRRGGSGGADGVVVAVVAARGRHERHGDHHDRHDRGEEDASHWPTGSGSDGLPATKSLTQSVAGPQRASYLVARAEARASFAGP